MLFLYYYLGESFMGKVTAKQLAQCAGVSQATVSLVLRGKPGVSEKERMRILKLSDEMGLKRPIGILQNQTNGLLQLILYKRHGKVVGDTLFFERLTQGVTEEAHALGYDLSVRYFYGSQPTDEQIRAIQSEPCEGIILLATEMHTADMAPFEKLKCPIVLLDNYFPSLHYDSVVIDNLYGAWRAVHYLIDCGHTRLGYLHSSVEIRNFRERQSGYLSALHALPEEAARDAARRIVRLTPTEAEARADMEAYLRRDPLLPTAFFSDNDRIAAGACEALLRFGYRIPQDVSVIGFDDSSISTALTPPLTTMQVQKQRLGALAVDRLHTRLQKNVPETLREALVPEVLVRESVLDRRNPPDRSTCW